MIVRFTRPFSIAALSVATGFAYLMSNLAQYGLEAWGIPPYPTEVAAQGLILVGLAFGLASIGNDVRFGTPFESLIIVVGLSTFWMLVTYLYSSQSAEVTQLLVQYLRAIAIIVTLAYAIAVTKSEALISYVALGLAVIGSLVNLSDFISPMFSQVPGRAAGLYANPNISGTVLVYLALIASLRLLIIPTYAIWSIVSLGVAVTFSRSAWLILIFSLVGLSVLGRLGTGKGRIVFVAVVSAIVGLVFISLISGDLYYIVARSPLAQYLDPNTIARLGASGSIVDDYSSLEREAVLRAGWQAFLESPAFGNGLGYTIEWSEQASTHNMFVLYLAERGVIGCLLYLTLLALLILHTRGIPRLLGLLFVIDGFFTHNQFDLLCIVCAISVAIASTARRASGTLPDAGGSDFQLRLNARAV